MGDPGLDPSSALQLIQTLLYSIAFIVGGAVLLGLSAYVGFLCLEIFSPQPRSRARRAKVRPAVDPTPATDEKLELVPAETPIPAAPEPVAEQAVPVPTVAQEAQTRKTIAPLTLGSESIAPPEASLSS